MSVIIAKKRTFGQSLQEKDSSIPEEAHIVEEEEYSIFMWALAE